MRHVLTTGRQVRKWVGMLLVAGLAGCSNPPANTGSGTSGGNTPAVPSANSGTTPASSDFKVGIVLDTGGKDDKSFNQAADAGLQKAAQEFKLDEAHAKELQSNSTSDYIPNLTNLASQNYNVVFAIGYKMQDAMDRVAKQFPNVKFVLVDGTAPKLPNCASLLFKEEQGSFLAGFLAASVSKSKKIGFVGGEQVDLIKKFEAGYRAGAKAAGLDPKTQVSAVYTGDWNDVGKGKSNAQQLFGSGVDIIYHAAGKAGLGVIAAAQEKGTGYYAIGVDSDQDDVAPGRVLTSMIKRLDVAVYNTIKDVKDGKFQPGDHIFDLKENGVGLSEMKYTAKDVPADVMTKIKTVTQMIADGKIVVPTTLPEVDTFAPPKI